MAVDDLTFPYGAPSISGTSLTLDFLLADPRRVTRAIANLALQKFYVDRVFSSAGPITGGAVAYEQATQNVLYATRDVGKVDPGKEFPIVTFDRGAPQTAQVEKFGGKFPVTDEARRRNEGGRVNRAVQRLANTIVRKTQQRALIELDAAITAFSRSAVGTGWSTSAGTTAGSKLATVGPLADLTQVELANEQQELGYEYDFGIFNPIDWRLFRLAAGGTDADANALLADSGITDKWITNRQTSGKVKWLASGQVGEIGYELPLSTETWRDPEGKQQDWFQSFVLPVMYVVEPYAILETTGHGA